MCVCVCESVEQRREETAEKQDSDTLTGAAEPLVLLLDYSDSCYLDLLTREERNTEGHDLHKIPCTAVRVFFCWEIKWYLAVFIKFQSEP